MSEIIRKFFYTTFYTENDKSLLQQAILNWLTIFYKSDIEVYDLQFDCEGVVEVPYTIFASVKSANNKEWTEKLWIFHVWILMVGEWADDQKKPLDDFKIVAVTNPWEDQGYWSKFMKDTISYNFKFAQTIRDTNGIYNVVNEWAIDSITKAPFNSFNGEEYYPDILDKAAFILYSIVKNHPFSDGNKRTAFLTLIAFLNRCGLMILLDDCLSVKDIIAKAEAFMILIANAKPEKKDESLEKIKQFILDNINIDINFQNNMLKYAQH